MTDTTQPDSTDPADGTEPADQTAEELTAPGPIKTAAPKTPSSHVAGLGDRP